MAKNERKDALTSCGMDSKSAFIKELTKEDIDLLEKDRHYLDTVVRSILLNSRFPLEDIDDVLSVVYTECIQSRRKGYDVTHKFMRERAIWRAIDSYRKNRPFVYVGLKVDSLFKKCDQNNDLLLREDMILAAKETLRQVLRELWQRERKNKYKWAEKVWCDEIPHEVVAKSEGRSVRTIYNTTNKKAMSPVFDIVRESLLQQFY